MSEKRGLKNYYKDWKEINWNPVSFEKDYLQETRRRFIIKIIKEHKPKKILEVGCGLNPIFPYVDDYNEYIIIEPIKEFCDEIKEKYKLNERIKILNTKLEYYWNDNKFDMIIISSLLHEVNDIREFLNCVKFFCDSNTIVHINVPNSNSFHRILGKEMGIIKDLKEHSELGKKLQRKHEFGILELVAVLIENGFKVINSETCLIKPFPNDIMEKIITPEIFEGLMKMTKHMPDLGAELCVNCKVI